MFKKILFAILVVFALLISARAEEDPADASDQLQQARAYQKDGYLLEAEQIYKTVVIDYPGTVYALRAQRNLVLLYISAKRDADARRGIDKLIADFPDHTDLPAALSRIAGTYKRAGKYEDANRIYQIILTDYSDSDSALKAQLNVPKTDVFSLIQSGQTEAAEAEIDNLIADFNDDPRLAAGLRHIARTYKEAKEYERAKELYQIVVTDFPDTNDALKAGLNVPKTNILSLIQSGQTEDAQAELDNLIFDFNDDPNLPAALYHIARRYEEYGKYEYADNLYKQIIGQYPDSSFALGAQLDIPKDRILLLIDDGNDTAAREALDWLIADFNDDPNLPDAIFRIAEQYYNQALSKQSEGPVAEAMYNFANAIAVWERIIQELPASPAYTPRAYYCSAVVYSQELRQYSKGIEYYQIIADNWPDYEYAWHAQYFVGMYYEILLKSGSLPESEANPKIEKAYIAVVENYPDCPSAKQACLKLGWLNFNKGQWVDAAFYFELFWQKSPQDPRLAGVVEALASAYEEMGQLDLAVQVCEQFLETDPANSRIKARLEKLEGATK